MSSRSVRSVGGGDLDDDEASTSTRARRSHSLTTAGVMDEAGALATALWARTGIASSNATDSTGSRERRSGATRRRLTNGDAYEGGWEKGRPHGHGRYQWVDGSKYEGQWLNGRKHGVGKYIWPSKAYYDGEWQEGSMQGFGRFFSADGNSYVGSWHRDQKNGIGIKRYKNGDVYEGLWLAGRPEGPGMYRWTDGSEYNGEWVAGRMHGRGTFVWPQGERYDGEWAHGQENGRAVFTWPDQSYYDGVWKDGQKHGVGVWAPFVDPEDAKHHRRGHRAGSTHDLATPTPPKHARRLTHAATAHFRSPSPVPPPPQDSQGARPDSAGLGMMETFSPATERSRSKPAAQETEADAEAAAPELRAVHPLAQSMDVIPGQMAMEQEAQRDGRGRRHSLDVDLSTDTRRSKDLLAKHMMIQEYEMGTLTREVPASLEFLQVYKPPDTAIRKAKKKKVKLVKMARNKQNQLGETIFKGHRSYDLMLNLQLGVRWSVQRTTSELTRELAKDDFSHVPREVRFPRQGRKTPPETPPHASGDFKFKDYCPLVFQKLREKFGIDAGDYVRSLCGDKALREMSSPGKSGSVFFLSHDDRFVCKTMNKEEMKMLRQMLSRYYQHVQQHDHTMLTKFYGLHRVKPHRGSKVRFVVMGNLFCTDVPLHRKYDLKGSTQGRLTPLDKLVKPTTVYKDLDIDMVFMLPKEWQAQFQTQLVADCEFLQSVGVMDYSLLLGVNFPDPDIASWATTGKPLPPEPSELLDSNEPPVVKRNTPGLYSTSMDDERLGDDDQDESTSLGRRKTAPAPDTRIGFETPAPDKAKAAIANGGATAERAGGVGGGGENGLNRDSAATPEPVDSIQAEMSDSLTPLELSSSSLQNPNTPTGHTSSQVAQLRTDLEVLIPKRAAHSHGLHKESRTSPQSMPESREIAEALNYRPWTLREDDAARMGGSVALQRTASGRATVSKELLESNGLRVDLGVNLPAVARPKRVLQWPESAGTPREPLVSTNTAVLLNFGIIDILQEYNMHKQAEHHLKGIIHDRHSISAVEPHEYAKRMISYFSQLFEY